MRDNIGANAVRLDDAPRGCERYEVDGADTDGRRMRSNICLHTCTAEEEAPIAEDSQEEEPKPARRSVRAKLSRSKK